MGMIESLLSAAVIGLAGWVVSIERRVTKAESLKELIEAKFDGLEENLNYKHQANEQRLARIERSLNGHLR